MPPSSEIASSWSLSLGGVSRRPGGSSLCPLPGSSPQPDALDHLDLFFALEVDKTERAALRLIAQMEPGAAADVDLARLAVFLDPRRGVDRVAPDVELELRLAHDAGRDRPVVDADPHRPIGAHRLR